MLTRFLAGLRIAVGGLLLITNTVLHVLPLLIVAIIKALLPWSPIRRAANWLLMALAESWIAINSSLFDHFTGTQVHVSGIESLRLGGHYLVLANHQSWVDIPVLQKIFNRRIPLLRFFLKSQLFWVPLLGLAWWALDFPFMKRYSRQTLERHPELAGRDIEATRRACDRFRDLPVAIMNFVEGTRFTPEKHQRQQSPFPHLLRPKAGGVAFVLDAMGQGLHGIIDVTVAYPAGRPSLADLLAGRIPEVRVAVRERPIPPELASGDYQGDAAFRERFQLWINGLWQEKEEELARLLEPALAPGQT